MTLYKNKILQFSKLQEKKENNYSGVLVILSLMLLQKPLNPPKKSAKIYIYYVNKIFWQHKIPFFQNLKLPKKS